MHKRLFVYVCNMIAKSLLLFMRNNFISLNLDFVGFSASLLCAVHCAAMPFLLSLLPLAGLHFLHHPAVEYSVILLSFLIASKSLTHGYVRHHKNIYPLLVVAFGFLLIGLGHTIHAGWVELGLIVPGATFVSIAHLLNWKYVQNSEVKYPECKVHHRQSPAISQSQPVVYDPEDLLKMDWNSTNLALLRRDSDPEITAFLQLLNTANFPDFNKVVFAKEVRSEISDHFEEYFRWHPQGCTRFVQDVGKLFFLFSKIVNEDRLRLVIKSVRDDACRKFHVDNYFLRLLCTYVGNGTEWLDEHNVNRGALLKSNEEIVKSPGQIHRMAPFEVGILKGEGRKVNIGKGIVHKSPKVSSTDDSRIIMRIDCP